MRGWVYLRDILSIPLLGTITTPNLSSLRTKFAIELGSYTTSYYNPNILHEPETLRTKWHLNEKGLWSIYRIEIIVGDGIWPQLYGSFDP